MDCPSCKNSIPIITEIISSCQNAFIAKHCCSKCNSPLFEEEVAPGVQLIATTDIQNHDKSYTVPRGRLLRVTAFSDLAANDFGFLFAGLFAAGSFAPRGFATKWDVNKITSLEL